MTFSKKPEMIREELQREALMVADNAKKLVQSESFVRYKKMYQRLEDNMIKAMASTQLDDPIKDAFFLRSLVDKVSILKMLVDNVEKDAK